VNQQKFTTFLSACIDRQRRSLGTPTITGCRWVMSSVTGISAIPRSRRKYR
jgi:hypothetical protein